MAHPAGSFDCDRFLMGILLTARTSGSMQRNFRVSNLPGFLVWLMLR
jgi:hypothetical protein